MSNLLYSFCHFKVILTPINFYILKLPELL
uniref:Uncharacterized protein n=1 Tax=Anguilla anguilla TaxID=7936 RepID=A0A0E9W3U3_ANGAN